MSIETGELLGESPIEAFDEAIISDSLCVSITAKKVTGISTSDLFEAWTYQREGKKEVAMPYWSLPSGTEDDPDAATELAWRALAYL